MSHYRAEIKGGKTMSIPVEFFIKGAKDLKLANIFHSAVSATDLHDRLAERGYKLTMEDCRKIYRNRKVMTSTLKKERGCY